MNSDTRTKFGKSVSEEAQGITQGLIRDVADTMRRWYWSRRNNLTRDDVVKPAIDVLEYAYKARKEGLDRRSETSYCGSILLYSVMSLTGRRHTSDVDEANELYEAGRKLASAIWDELDRFERSKKGVKDGMDSVLADILGKISDGFWEEYRRVNDTEKGWKGPEKNSERKSGGIE